MADLEKERACRNGPWIKKIHSLCCKKVKAEIWDCQEHCLLEEGGKSHITKFSENRGTWGGGTYCEGGRRSWGWTSNRASSCGKQPPIK